MLHHNNYDTAQRLKVALGISYVIASTQLQHLIFFNRSSILMISMSSQLIVQAYIDCACLHNTDTLSLANMLATTVIA